MEGQEEGRISGGKEVGQKTKMTKEERRNNRKAWAKVKALNEQLGFEVNTDVPNEWVVIWGIGISNGVSKQDVFNHFNPKPEEIRLFQDQTYVILKFSLNDAKLVQERYHGTKFKQNQKLFVMFPKSGTVIPNEDREELKLFQDVPDGATFIPDLVDSKLEAFLIDKFKIQENGTNLKKRTVMHFGYEFRYGLNDVDVSRPLEQEIPPYLEALIEKMKKDLPDGFHPDQITVNQYTPGQGIPPHCDTHSIFEGPIITLSLGSDAVMVFKKGEIVRKLVLPRLWALVMDGEIRLDWTHEIPARKFDIIPDRTFGGLTVLARETRISITFRQIRRGPAICRCLYPTYCDTQQKEHCKKNRVSLGN